MMLKKYKYPILLCTLLTILLIIVTPNGMIYGSETDWLSQHISIADHIRNVCYETKQILPEYSALGAGSNMFMFAYYGILRPDVLIGLLLPAISMQNIIIGYSIIGIYASMLLCYYWLNKHCKDSYICFISSLIFVCAACFFQTHRQIMFINYMPFVLLLLISIDYHHKSKKILPMILSFFFIFLHSFFFSVSCFVVGLLYVIYRKDSIVPYIISCALSAGLAAIVLLPTALTILENKKDTGVSSSINLLGIQPSLESLLYSPYGCGLTGICLYTLLLSIKDKKTRILATSILILLFFNVCSYLLNGTLYVRNKAFIPFVPLIILLCTLQLEKLHRTQSWWQPDILVIVCLFTVFQSKPMLYVLDIAIVVLFLCLMHHYYHKSLYALLCIIPICSMVQANSAETYIKVDDQRQHRFTTEELQTFYTDSMYRFDTINASLTNVNYSPIKGIKKTTMYSSTMNTKYSTYFYDSIRNPISIKNRVALLANQNPFFSYMMGVRYIQTYKEAVPYGYVVKQEKNGFVLAENENVLPIGYASSNLYSEKNLHSLDFPYNLDVLTNNSIVNTTTKNEYTSKMMNITKDINLLSYLENLGAITNNNETTVSLDKEEKLYIPIHPDLQNKILVIGFHIESPKGKEVQIEINKIVNKLSAINANYPNYNHDFVYMLSNNQGVEELNITLPKGNYVLSDISVHALNPTDIGQDIQPLKVQKNSKHDVLKGKISWEQDGYFITSLPYQKGYSAYVDNKKVDIEVVNTAFVGFPLEKGEHQITIEFHAPGKQLGLYITSGSILIVAGIMMQERGKRLWQKN